MKRVNVRFFVGAVASFLLLAVGLYFLHDWQVVRNADGHARRADQHLAKGERLEAAQQLALYLEYRKGDVKRRIQCAFLLIDLAQSEGTSSDLVRAAISETEKALRAAPGEDALREKLVELLVRAGEPQVALEHLDILRQRPGFDGAPSEDPQTDERNVKLDTMYARSCIEVRLDEEAIEVLGKIVAYVPQVRAFDTSIKLPTGRAGAFLMLAGLLERQFKDPDAAEGVISRMTEVSPDDPVAWRNLSWWRDTHGDVEAARVAIEKSIELAPKDNESLFQEFCVAIRQRRIDRAEAIINGLLGDVASSPAFTIARADLALAKGDTEEMVRVLRDGVERFPEETRLLTKYVFSLADLKKFDELKEAVNRASELVGRNSVPVMYAEAVEAMEQHRWIKSLGLWLKLRPLLVSDASYTRMVDLRLASCHDALGESDLTLGAGYRLLNEDPNLIEALLTLALTFERAGWSARSLELCETIVREMPVEQLASRPAVFVPLVRMRLWEQTSRPAAERDWTRVDTLIDDLSNANPAEPIDPALLEGLKIDVIEAKGQRQVALERSAIAVTTYPRSPILLGQRAVLLGGDSALQLIDEATDELRNSPEMLRAAVLIALESPQAVALRRLQDVEQRAVGLSVTSGGRVRQELVAGFLQMGDVAGARRVAASMVQLNGDDLSSFMTLIDLAFAEEDFASAIRHAETLVKLVHADNANGRYGKAVRLVASVLERRRDRLADDVVGAALAEVESQDLEEARFLLVEVANDRPRWGAVPRLLGEIAELQGDRNLAIGEMQRAIDLGGRQWATLRRLALMLHGAGRFEEAREVIRELEGRGGVAIERILADMEVRSGRVSAALARGERITPDECRDPLQWMWYGRLLGSCGRPREAELAFRRAILVAPDRIDCRLAIVRFFVSQGMRGDAREAIRVAEKALEGEQRELFALRSLEAIEDFSEAESILRSRVEAAPEDLNAARNLAELMLRAGREDEACGELRRILSLEIARGTSTAVWAKRLLAAHLAKGTYLEFQEALGLMAIDPDDEGPTTTEDLAVVADFVNARGEPVHWRQTIDLLKKLGERRPLSVDERFMLARSEARLGNWEAARKELLDISLSEDATPALRAFFVDGLIDHGDLLGARQWMERSRVGEKDSVATRRLELKLAVAEGNQPKIERALQKLLPDERVRKENFDRLLAGAVAAEELGFHEAAGRFYEEYASLTTLGAFDRAAFLGRRGRTREAVDLLAGVIGEFPFPRVLGAIQTILQSGAPSLDPDVVVRVKAILERARRENPGNLEIEFRGASIAERIGDPGEAEAIYRKLLASGQLNEQESGRVAANLAWLLATAETAQEASSLIDRAIRVLGPDSELLDTRSMIRVLNGQPVRALEDIRTAVVQPTPLRQLHLAIIEAANGQLSEARTAFAASIAGGLRSRWLSAADQRRLSELEKLLAEAPAG